jgi:uncharacterized protein YcnI
MFVSHALRRAGTVAGLAAAGTLAFAAAASAHVTVTAEKATPGAFTKLAFSVPNEEPKADTTKLVVDIPTDHPLAFASVRPVPGWTAKVTTTKLPKTVDGIDEAVSRITWSGGRIKPGEFQLFEVSGGPLPKNAATLAFKATQTYSDGKVVKWADPPKANGQEPEHPAPTITLAPAPSATRAVSNTTTGGSGDSTARLLGGAALVVAVLAAVVAFVRRRPGGAS